MHPLKIVILLILFYLLYRLYISGRKKRLAGRERAAGRPALEDVLVQDPVCGAYVAKGQALSARRDGREHYFCSEDCRRAFQNRNQDQNQN